MTTHDLAITLPSEWIASAWLPVWCATTKHPNPILDRTLAVEWHPRGIRLIATDSTILLTGWVGVTEGEPAPDLDEAPDATIVVADHDKRGHGLITYANKISTKDEDGDVYDHTLTLKVGEPERSQRTPALAAELEARVLVIHHNGETVELPIIEADYPSWRSWLTATNPTPTRGITLSPDVLGALAKTGRPLAFRFSGPDKLARIHADAPQPLLGAAMPVRESENVREAA